MHLFGIDHKILHQAFWTFSINLSLCRHQFHQKRLFFGVDEDSATLYHKQGKY
jgi:hypothetical protein